MHKTRPYVNPLKAEQLSSKCAVGWLHHVDSVALDRLTNPLERLNGESKRRTGVGGIFRNQVAIVRLVGALLLEGNDEWAPCRRYIWRESLPARGDKRFLSLSAITD